MLLDDIIEPAPGFLRRIIPRLGNVSSCILF
jgi:hypothetical protein